MDLTATILDAAHFEMGQDKSLDGTTLRPLLQGKKLERDALYFHYPHFAWHQQIHPKNRRIFAHRYYERPSLQAQCNSKVPKTG